MRRVITGATGLIGKRVVESWLKQNIDVTVIGRSREKIEKAFGLGVKSIAWDSLTLDDLKDAEVVLNLAGASVGEKRWTEERKQEIINSRVKATNKIATLLAELGPASPPLFNASAIGIYGLQVQEETGLPARFDDISAIDKANDFLSFVGQTWENAAAPAVEAGVRVVFLRFGVVLAKEGGALPQMMLPFQYYVGGTVGTGKQPFSWVAIDDVVRAINFLIAKSDVQGPFNIVSPEAVTQRQFAQVLAHLMNRPAFVPMPGFALKLMLGKEMATDLLLEGQHVYPLKLLNMGFQFSYVDLESALNRVLKTK